MKYAIPPEHTKNIKRATKSRIRDPLFAAGLMVSLFSLFRIKTKICE